MRKRSSVAKKQGGRMTVPSSQFPGRSSQLVVFRFLFSAACFLLIVILSSCGSESNEGISELEGKLTAQAVSTTTASSAVAESPPASQNDDAAAVEPTEAPAPETAEQPVETEQEADAGPPPEDPALQEAGATATARAVELAATSAAASQANEAAQAATADALAPIQEELAMLGVDPSQGELGFTHPPISLEVTEFEGTAFANRNAFTVAQDFVMAADVTWESRFAESGCGFVVRSDGEEESPNQYIIGLTRGAEGHVLFAEQVAGDVDLSDVTDIYANGIDPRFEWKSGTTNRLVVIGRGQEFNIYSNGTYLGTVNGKAGFEEGFVAFIAVNRSGGIKCDYNNAWLWKIN